MTITVLGGAVTFWEELDVGLAVQRGVIYQAADVLCDVVSAGGFPVLGDWGKAGFYGVLVDVALDKEIIPMVLYLPGKVAGAPEVVGGAVDMVPVFSGLGFYPVHYLG